MDDLQSKQVLHLIRDAIAKEREACAVMLDDLAESWRLDDPYDPEALAAAEAVEQAATAIRARGASHG